MSEKMNGKLPHSSHT